MQHQFFESVQTRDRLDKVFRSYNDTLVRYLTLRTKSVVEAMEIAQEAYLRVLAMPDSNKIIDMESFLFGISRNLHIDRVRSTICGFKAIEKGGMAVAYGGSTTEMSHVGPEEDAVANEILEKLKTVIEGLAPKCQQAFLLYKFEGIGYAEVASRMGLTESMVRKYVLHAVRVCHQSLGMDGQVQNECD
ncbi:RNA polymerase sigma factor [Denitratisoma oestradiolicum]|uniref:Putative RNA polymerase sigma factor FecI n=1 Tax=Denitratisoma oestradiolicum TaxID=311182 RepID=A0A6S6Y3M4_9PROT|nr:sigma-70 family RNA polymerase sigma factor [Denitratisoma oestradiolicum]TWO78867.1 hypothetical protein CBW56_17750 [Denitratisoma oestradiolicum]CAB1369868.1 putative RNA polymerase sigma factor FecI [Denitratisoma oestradiolicum]